MAGSLGDDGEVDCLEFSVGKSPAASVYIALLTADPLDNEAGFAEVSGGSYARKATAAGGTDWNPASAGAPSSIDNANDLTFVTATADWGIVTHIAIMTALTFGDMRWHMSLAVSRDIKNGDTFTLPAGAIILTLA
jgi:hypothetical protein